MLGLRHLLRVGLWLLDANKLDTRPNSGQQPLEKGENPPGRGRPVRAHHVAAVRPPSPHHQKRTMQVQSQFPGDVQGRKPAEGAAPRAGQDHQVIVVLSDLVIELVDEVSEVF